MSVDMNQQDKDRARLLELKSLKAGWLEDVCGSSGESLEDINVETCLLIVTVLRTVKPNLRIFPTEDGAVCLEDDDAWIVETTT